MFSFLSMREDEHVRLNNSTAATIGTGNSGLRLSVRTVHGVRFLLLALGKRRVNSNLNQNEHWI
jgi:hypothetical protein